MVDGDGGVRFSEEARQRIVAESFSGAVRSVSETARKHGVSRAQLYRWRRLYRDRAVGAVEGFVPVSVEPEASCGIASFGIRGSRMEVVSANGRHVIVDGDVDVDALLRLLAGLERL